MYFYVGIKRLFRPENFKKNFLIEQFFRIISLKSVIRCEYSCINRFKRTFYIGIKGLYRPRKVS
jgi:hypothetical protein